MIHKKITLACAALLLYSCTFKSKNASDSTLTGKEEQDELHWSYQGETGPEHWSEIEKNSNCNGQQQSPINIIDIDVVQDSLLASLQFNYSDSIKIHDITNNGHSIQYDFEKGDYVILQDKKYKLMQIHFHEPSEHTINGIRFPIEIHLVHVSKEDNDVAVIAIFGKEGENSTFFEFLESYLPIQVGETKKIDAHYNLISGLPKNLDYYTYQGSLTTPPCTEGVHWYVLKTPITISVDQVKKLQALMPLNNYRNEQPKNSRTIKTMLIKAKLH